MFGGLLVENSSPDPLPTYYFVYVAQDKLVAVFLTETLGNSLLSYRCPTPSWSYLL
jgi:hypothetical protein